jgi:hypothetical protein
VAGVSPRIPIHPTTGEQICRSRIKLRRECGDGKQQEVQSMNGSEKVIFHMARFVFLLTAGFAYPHILQDHLHRPGVHQRSG